MSATRYLPFAGRVLIGLPFAMAGFGKLTVCAVYFHSNFAEQNQMIHFLKNVMLTGGLLQIATFGAGAFSLDERLSNGGAAFAKVALAR